MDIICNIHGVWFSNSSHPHCFLPVCFSFQPLIKCKCNLFCVLYFSSSQSKESKCSGLTLVVSLHYTMISHAQKVSRLAALTTCQRMTLKNVNKLLNSNCFHRCIFFIVTGMEYLII